MSASTWSVIPTPPAQRWREFRFQILPGLTFFLGLVAVILLWSQYVIPISMPGPGAIQRAHDSSPKTGSLAQSKMHPGNFMDVTLLAK